MQGTASLTGAADKSVMRRMSTRTNEASEPEQMRDRFGARSLVRLLIHARQDAEALDCGAAVGSIQRAIDSLNDAYDLTEDDLLIPKGRR